MSICTQTRKYQRAGVQYVLMNLILHKIVMKEVKVKGEENLLHCVTANGTLMVCIIWGMEDKYILHVLNKQLFMLELC